MENRTYNRGREWMHKGVPLGTEPKKKHTPEHGPYWGFYSDKH
jgi:hypothetical protein